MILTRPRPLLNAIIRNSARSLSSPSSACYRPCQASCKAAGGDSPLWDSLIFDEVVTSFRFAYGGAQEYYGVTPDLAAIGKIVGGGYPLAAVVGKADMMSTFVQPNKDGVAIGQVGTLNGNPIAAAAGLATLTVLRQPGTYQRLHELGQQLRAILQATLREHRVAGQVLGDGPLYHVVFTPQPIHHYRDTLTGDTQNSGSFIASS